MTAGDDRLAFLSVAEQARLMERREISPVDLVEIYLRRIERWDPIFRAYITVCGDRARAKAREAEREIAAGRYRGPLHGIPYGVKDQLCTRGILTTLGSRILADHVPDHDATVIERLDAAGGILLGKQNLHEFGKGGTVHFPFGQPRNPWHAEQSPSSSSSGSGVATAAGLCSFSLGEDTGGSIRGPAAANGVVGLRPTFGRVSRYGGVMFGWTNDTIGPLTRTVGDCAIVLEAIAGADPKDPLASHRPVPDYGGAMTPTLKGVRLAVVREMASAEGIHPEVRSAMDAAVDVFRSLGATVEEVSLPRAKHAIPLQMLTSDVDVGSAFLRRWLRTRWHEFDRGTRTRLATASLVPAAVYTRAMAARRIVRREILEALSRYDALLSPTNLTPPERIDESPEKADMSQDLIAKQRMRRLCNFPFSVANVPAMAIPMGFTQSDLPLSLQIAARPFAEDVILRMAHAYEQSTPWRCRHPDLEAAGKQRVGREPWS